MSAAAAAFVRHMRRIRNIKSIFRLFVEQNVHSFVRFYLFLLLPKKKKKKTRKTLLSPEFCPELVWAWHGLFSVQNYWKSSEVKSVDKRRFYCLFIWYIFSAPAIIFIYARAALKTIK